MKQKIFKTILSLVAVFSAPLAFADTCISAVNSGDHITNFCGLASLILGMLNKAVIPILMALAIVFFIAGVVQYVINPSSSEEREKGQQYMIWGIVGLFAIVSVWGLVAILTGTFGIENLIPQLQQ